MRVGIAVAGLLALAACEDGGGAPSVAAAPEPILRVESAAPGPRNVPVRFAQEVLQTACLDTRPGFDGATQALARAGGFAQSAKTGTFFHQTYDLSVKVTPRRCSMVSGVAGNTARLSSLSATPGVEAGVPRVFGDRTYLSFYVSGT